MGVIDWAEAEILPFGCALWGLENVLGFMDLHGWHYFDSHKELEDLFGVHSRRPLARAWMRRCGERSISRGGLVFCFDMVFAGIKMCSRGLYLRWIRA
jgi:hypothetical protein